LIEQQNEEGNSEEDLLLEEMKNAGIDEASVPELKLQLQQYIAKLKINSDEEHSNDHYDQDNPVVDTNLLAFDKILLDAIDDAMKPRSRSISDQIRENSLINDDDHDNVQDDDDNVQDDDYNVQDDDDNVQDDDDNVQDDDDYRHQLDSDGYDCSSGSSDGDDYSTEEEDEDDGDDMVIDDEDGADDDKDVEYFEQDDEENEDVESDAYLTEEEWQDILARYKKPAVTELERERERVYSMFEDYDVEKAEMIDDLEIFKQMR